MVAFGSAQIIITSFCFGVPPTSAQKKNAGRGNKKKQKAVFVYRLSASGPKLCFDDFSSRGKTNQTKFVRFHQIVVASRPNPSRRRSRAAYPAGAIPLVSTGARTSEQSAGSGRETVKKTRACSPCGARGREPRLSTGLGGRGGVKGRVKKTIKRFIQTS